jgi:hypothetical protein
VDSSVTKKDRSKGSVAKRTKCERSSARLRNRSKGSVTKQAKCERSSARLHFEKAIKS